MSDLRLIKKYPNRRLYDTQISRYITLEEIRQLVLDGEEFQVVDKSSQGGNLLDSVGGVAGLAGLASKFLK